MGRDPLQLLNADKMTDKTKAPKVERRQVKYASRTPTRIWQEEPTADNPYLPARCRCHGYDLFELMAKRRFADVLFLLFNGELPTADQADLLEALMIACINPGPRHPATRAAMNAGVGKTYAVHILPIALSVMGGQHLGGGEVEETMRFLRRSLRRDAAACAQELLAEAKRPAEGDWHIAPGFGSRFGGIDPLPNQMAGLFHQQPASGAALAWGAAFAEALAPHNLGWLLPGVAAAVLCDLGFHPRAGSGLFQIFTAPGLLAHGLELANKPITAMPFLDKEHYVIDEQARNRRK